MSVLIDGMIATEIYTTNEGLVAIEQPNEIVVWLSPDQLAEVIRQLQVCYDSRAAWREPSPE